MDWKQKCDRLRSNSPSSVSLDVAPLTCNFETFSHHSISPLHTWDVATWLELSRMLAEVIEAEVWETHMWPLHSGAFCHCNENMMGLKRKWECIDGPIKSKAVGSDRSFLSWLGCEYLLLYETEICVLAFFFNCYTAIATCYKRLKRIEPVQ